MKITRQMYDEIISQTSDFYKETGGIIGGNNGVISIQMFDTGSESDCMCRYTPSTKILNDTIKHWQESELEFMGLYHTHFHSVSTLSDSDRECIKQILINMPSSITTLFFPVVVLPDKTIVSYKASYNNQLRELAITEDDIVIV